MEERFRNQFENTKNTLKAQLTKTKNALKIYIGTSYSNEDELKESKTSILNQLNLFLNFLAIAKQRHIPIPNKELSPLETKINQAKINIGRAKNFQELLTILEPIIKML